MSSQPWLDDLSEDWDDRPPIFSPPPNLETPIKIPASRVPRLPSSPALAEVLNSDIPAAPPSPSPSRPLPGKRKIALAERTNSDNNILNNVADPPARSVSAESTGSVVQHSAAEIKPPTSRSISAESTGSVVQHSTVEIKPSSAAPARQKKLQDTPEWRRRLLNGKMGYGDQKDLFSPMGLENMFQPPTLARSSPISKRRAGISAIKDSFAMPSSPPPWPSQLSRSRSSPARDSLRWNLNNNSMNPDAGYGSGSEEHVSDEDSDVSWEGEHDDGSENEEDDDVSETGSEVRHPPAEKDAAEHIPEAGPFRHQKHDSQDASLPDMKTQDDTSKLGRDSAFGRLPALNVSSAQKSRALSGHTELTDDSFGPVYITKHRTEDGNVQYAAVDLSKSELEKMRNQPAEQQPPQQPNFDESLHSYGSMGSQPMPADLPTGTPEQVTAGDYVNMKRGEFSADGLFKAHPPSPSPQERKNSDYGSFPSNSSGSGKRPHSRLRYQFMPRHSSPPMSPSTPARRPNSSYLYPERPQSSSSPLKLFGDHDTFTANKLQRRMSQLEDTLFQEEHAAESRRQSGGGAVRRIDHRLPSVEEASFQKSGALHDEIDELGSDSEEEGGQLAFGESASSYFGRGDLDDYPFPESFGNSQQSSQEPAYEDDDRSGSPPPGSAPRFQFSLNDGIPRQSIHSKRKLSRHSVKSWTTTVSNRDSIQIPKSPRLGLRRALAARGDLEQAEGKRAPPSPFKNPSAKRRRTLLPMDVEDHEDVPHSEERSRERSRPGYGRRSQEPRPDRQLHSANPDLHPRRQFLRPRNPTPSQRRREQIQADILEATEAYLDSSPKQLQVIQEHLESPDTHGHPSYAEDERAVATQIAAFSVKLRQSMKDEDRKKSVTTQDFLDEARFIMDHIRAKGRPNSALQSLAESGDESPAREDVNWDFLAVPDSPLTFSRPPSREGFKGGWRHPGAFTENPRIASHLRKFKEDDGDDFMASSVRSLNVKHLEDRTQEESDFFQGQSPDIRILTNHLTQRRRQRGQSNATRPDSRESSGHDDDSGQSRPSTMESSFGKTNLTTFSRRSDNVATLPPEAVAHLIPQEIAGMSFDRDKGIWIRSRNAGGPTASANVSHMASEEDPLGNIPDLTVDEVQERRSIGRKPRPLDDLKRPREEDDVFFDKSAASASPSQPVEPSSDTARPRTRDGAEIPPSDTNSAPSKFSSHFSSSVTQAETRATSMSERHANYIPKHIRREETIMEIPSPQHDEDSEHDFKSFDDEAPPKTSGYSFERHREEAGGKFSRIDSPAPNSLSRLRYFDDDEAQDLPTPLKNDFITPRSRLNGYRRATKQTVTDFSQSPSPARDNEMSIVKHPESEQKRMKFQVSVSRNGRSPAVIPQSPANPYSSNPVGLADVTFVLSELPPFTISGEDEHELPNRTLVKRNGGATVNVLEDRYAQGTMELIKALQDNEPEEPFWEDLRRLDLQQKDLPTLNRLDELCYRIEALDVSNNHIAQLAGAPTSLRRLNISNNCLNSLTSWSHLTNLQYLDVSGNAIDSLKGFSMLIHLRELKVDDNEVDSLEGVLELDGLLKLSAKGNKIRRVDFQGAYLERLTELDLSDNEISSIRSLDTLKSLEILNLDENDLSTFSSGRVSRVKRLGLSRNRLARLDVSSFRSLETLGADSNNLSSISGIAKLRNLRALSVRDQHPASGVFDTASFLANTDISELCLSSNTIPTLSFPEDEAGNTVPLLNLQRLELASCGLHTLPDKFGAAAPNIRSLNLNFNALKELRPLLNSKKLARLDLAGNRLSRLRRNVLVLGKVPSLRRVDLRNNAFNVGFYPPPSADRRVSRAGLDPDDADADNDADSSASVVENSLLEQEADQQRLPQHLVLPSADEDRDRAYLSRLDADTELRRRVYEMLVASACGAVRSLDGLPFRREECMRRDGVWERLVGLGVVRKKGKGVGVGVGALEGGGAREGLVLEERERERPRGKSAAKVKGGFSVGVREVGRM
ncbi:conserved leucine-rich repeat protein [Diplodia corticola]|uniref:Conserved leucine-rich repeat protein n=1 Tax=Diplodia corticola TaxID=236234 RepID=A0A1J9SE28_9PEZI|nr:conserved leucine-rich repeat protein [Diplodia corticola]OJD38687.1 conserved leucine-rich repeat protein [Diplodia corticola]